MPSLDQLSADDRQLLNRVHHGYYCNVTAMPEELCHLADAGLIEKQVTATLPLLPIRYRIRLTLLGEQFVTQTARKTHTPKK